MPSQRTVLVTGVSGNLGTRLLPFLSEFQVVGVDVRPPPDSSLARFAQMDLGREASCRELIDLLRASRADTVVHLAFVLDPLQSGVLDLERMWQINVAGTARVMEAISVVNRTGGDVRQFIFPSSVAAYGPETGGPVKEEAPLRAHTLPYAIHKRESDEVVRYRAESLGDCRTYILRPHIFAGASVENYMVGMLRGTAFGKSKRAARMRAEGRRLPLMLPRGPRYLEKRFQFVHIDDMARLLTVLLYRANSDPGVTVMNVAGHGDPDPRVTVMNVAGRGDPDPRVTVMNVAGRGDADPRVNVMNVAGRGDADPRVNVMNVAGRGDAITIQRCAEIAHATIKRAPTRAVFHSVLRFMWKFGISSIPPEALPYLIGSYTMDTTRLQQFLGADYPRVIQYTVEDALKDSFRSVVSSQ